MKSINRIKNKLLLCVLVLALCLTGCSNPRNNEPTFTYMEYPFPGDTTYAIEDFSRDFYGEIVFPTEYNGYPVEYILDSTFAGGKMESIRMESIICIYPNVFRNCWKLTNVELGCVELIGVNAFRDCTALASITIPASVRKIGGGAFSDCINLSAIYFEGEPKYIAPSAFDKRGTIYGPASSIVEEYALSRGIRFCEWYPSK